MKKLAQLAGILLISILLSGLLSYVIFFINILFFDKIIGTPRLPNDTEYANRYIFQGIVGIFKTALIYILLRTFWSKTWFKIIVVLLTIISGLFILFMFAAFRGLV